jgi:polysaccharide export outer membrane protein
MSILLLCLLVLISVGCTPLVYEDTSYALDEFIADSSLISRGKFGILQVQEKGIPIEYSNQELLIDGDELSISLYNPSRIDHVDAFKSVSQRGGFRISDGKVSLPCLGCVDVKELSLQEVKEKIQRLYCEQFSDGQFFINYKKRKERFVQIIGGAIGTIPVDVRTRLNEVLAKAGVPPQTNLFKSYVIRSGSQLPVDLYKLLHEGDLAQNIVMRGGDQIFLAEGSDASVMVTGEIPKSMAIPLPNGIISLREALAIAGGIPFTGDKCCIGVIRGGSLSPKVYCLNWRELTSVSNNSLLLIPGDVVVISETHLVQWNRFINQLQPSYCTMQTVYDIYELNK